MIDPGLPFGTPDSYDLSAAMAAEGDTIDVSVDQGALHFFDPETGLAIRDA